MQQSYLFQQLDNANNLLLDFSTNSAFLVQSK